MTSKPTKPSLEQLREAFEKLATLIHEAEEVLPERLASEVNARLEEMAANLEALRILQDREKRLG